MKVSASPQTLSEIFFQAFRYCAIDLVCSKSSFLFKVGVGTSLLINLALVVSLFNVVTIVSKGLSLKHFSDLSEGQITSQNSVRDFCDFEIT